MGIYINKGNSDFLDIVNHEFIDKSGLISVINDTLNSERRYSCVTRCRRFGKSMAAKMLYAYYDWSCDSRSLFSGLIAEKSPSFDKNLNKYPTIYLDITDFTTRYRDEDIVDKIQHSLIDDLKSVFPDVLVKETDDLMDYLYRIKESGSERFIFIIDEWDAILRELGEKTAIVNRYVDFLRRLFKGAGSNSVFAGVYLTGILPIKRYNTQSALNNFREYSMVDPAYFASYFGFTEDEVKELARKHDMDINDLKQWYDGYVIGDEKSIYNPYSVMEAVRRKRCKSYWATTGAFDSVRTYIQMNFNGLKDTVVRMLSGEKVDVNTSKFQNDLNVVTSKDDVLTVLIHLGYLAYDEVETKCFIPNKEVADEFSNAVEETTWTQLANVIRESRNLLESTISCDEKSVAKAIDQAHDENTSILSYNDENSLACVLSIAYIWAKNEYIIHRELASGKGYADLVLIPRRNVEKPAIVLELKYNNSADSAIEQVKQKNYPAKIAEYSGDILLVGINYDKESKKHTCMIEKFRK